MTWHETANTLIYVLNRQTKFHFWKCNQFRSLAGGWGTIKTISLPAGVRLRPAHHSCFKDAAQKSLLFRTHIHTVLQKYALVWQQRRQTWPWPCNMQSKLYSWAQWPLQTLIPELSIQQSLCVLIHQDFWRTSEIRLSQNWFGQEK